MTDPGLADATYIEPITPDVVARIGEALPVGRNGLGDQDVLQRGPLAADLEVAVAVGTLERVMHLGQQGVGVRVVAGDTKVLRRGEGGGVYFATTGVGVRLPGARPALGNIRERLALAFGSRASLVTHSDRERFYAVLSVPHVRHIDR